MISALAMCRAACAANSIINTAPIAKFGAMNTLALAVFRSSRSWGLKPVVPITTWTPASTASRALATALVGIVKSTSTSAPSRTSASDVFSAGSARPVSSMSGADSTARHTVWPIRPAAPATATRMALGTLGGLHQRRPDRGERLVEARLVGADARGGQAVRRPQLIDKPGQVIERHGVDPLDGLIQRQQRHAGEDLRPEPVHARTGRLEREHDPTLEILLGPLELVRRGRLLAYALELGSNHGKTLGDVVGPRPD